GASAAGRGPAAAAPADPLGVVARRFLLDRLVDHLVPVLADVVAQLATHLLHPPGHAPGVVLVQVPELTRIGQGVHTVVFGPHGRETREEAGEALPAAARATRGRRVGQPHGEEAHPTAAIPP